MTDTAQEPSVAPNQAHTAPVASSDEPQFKMTPKAIFMAKDALAKRKTPNAALRVGVKGGGCSGFSYVIEFADSKRSKDIVYVFDGLEVVVDPKSLLLLAGSTLDYEVKLMQRGFKFINPHEQSGCGCGESFNV
jgi:iron-sulfur cluster assembly protein